MAMGLTTVPLAAQSGKAIMFTITYPASTRATEACTAHANSPLPGCSGMPSSRGLYDRHYHPARPAADEVSVSSMKRISPVRRAFAFLPLLLVLLLVPEFAGAQALNTGTIAGNVTDSQGSIVPNATATLTNTTQNAVLTVKVNGKGEYLFTDVAAGTYALRIVAPTFAGYSVLTIELNADQNVRIDAKLQAGEASETVTVDAPSLTVDTRSATIATVIDQTLVENLPVDGNNIVSLAALLPGVTNVNAPTTNTSDTGGPTFNVSGARSNQNLFLLDGLFWNNNYYNTGLSFPPQYMVHELSVQLNDFKAQYGRNVGSIVNVLTRVGTNAVHGDAWEYFQNSAFDASDYIFQRNPHLVQNQFGATIGGPIRRDKAFYFLGLQVLRNAGEVVSVANTPTLAERGLLAPGVPRPCVTSYFNGMTCAYFGDVLAYSVKPPTGPQLAAGTAGIKNPLGSSNAQAGSALSELNSLYNSQGGVGNSPCVQLLQSPTGAGAHAYLQNGEIPSVCFNPFSVNVYNQFLPLPTIFSTPSAGGTLPQAVTSAKQPRNEYDGLARIDYNLNSHHTIDARAYITNVDDYTSNSSASGIGVATYEIDNNSGGIYSGNVGDTWVVRSNMLNVARFGYKRYNYTINPTNTTTGIALGANFVQRGYPVLPRIEAASNRFTLGSSNSPYSYSVNANYETDDSFSWTLGNHNLQFGAQFLSLDYIHRFDQEPVLEAEDQNTGLSTADFLFGLSENTTVGNTTNISAKQHAFYGYAQDDWRATSRLTLNLGLRYELPFNWFQPDGQSITFIPGYQSKVFPQAPSSIAYQGDPGISNGIVATQVHNLAPRFGFAYDAGGNGKTAIRGGFGFFYDTLNANSVGVGQPYHYQAGYSFAPGSFSVPTYQLPDAPPNYTNRASAQFVVPYSINFADANLTTPYTMAFNFGLQQKIRVGTLEINYVGKLGRHQIIPFDQNPAIYDCSGAYFQANPTLYCPVAASSAATGASYSARVKYANFNYGGQGVVDNATIATSNYNGLQIIYTQRNAKPLSTVASYTYSRSIDEQSNGATNTANVPTYNIRDNYGPSDFHATHVLNMGWNYKLPRVREGNVVERAIVNGWTFAGIYAVRTGNPFTVTISGDRSLTDSRTQRAFLWQPQLGAAGDPHRHRVDKVAQWFNLAAFENPTPTCSGTPQVCTYTYGQPNYGTLGNVGRNSLYGPAYQQINFSLRRDLQFSEGVKGEFRADAFNVFNTPNLAQPQASFSASSAIGVGQILNTVGTNGAATTNGRRVQLSFILHY